MPSDPAIAERLRQAALPRGFEERYFFGGVAQLPAKPTNRKTARSPSKRKSKK